MHVPVCCNCPSKSSSIFFSSRGACLKTPLCWCFNLDSIDFISRRMRSIRIRDVTTSEIFAALSRRVSRSCNKKTRIFKYTLPRNRSMLHQHNCTHHHNKLQMECWRNIHFLEPVKDFSGLQRNPNHWILLHDCPISLIRSCYHKILLIHPALDFQQNPKQHRQSGLC